ncbi:transcriptional regulator vib-1 [Phlyctema vagabunda]|uniref:Transcriptional regulator vib-1 n=1 Tax=Phlyctema vagabunda TaxID=108571 RepID=A0ABR4PHA0_9HELO
MSLTQSITMANAKPEDSDSSLWQGYHMPPTSQLPPFDASFHTAPLNLAYQGRHQKGAYRSLDIPSSDHTRPGPREGEAVLTASPPSLSSHHSYPSLKRSFVEDAHYGETVHDFREEAQDLPKPTIQQDHRLLSFSRIADKNTILDQHGRVQQIDLMAQIHGMFFLSEMGTPGVDGTVQPELTCYRRNLFQISGSVTAPRGSLSLITERGERISILALEVMVSAIESVDGHNVKLIVIPWKTPPPNSPEVGPGQEHEPTPIPLLPYEDNSPDVNSDYAIYPIAYRRLQFRIATANNGRRRELQQHFVLHLNIIATLANGQKVPVCQTATSPIVVRGRSPRNFQARKEIPLVGSSASRGQAPELQVVSTVAPPRPALNVETKTLKSPAALELPRGPFTFDASSLSSSSIMMRQQQQAYPSWSATQHQSEHNTASVPSYQPQSAVQTDYLHVSHSDSTYPPGTTVVSGTTMPAPQSISRSQYQYYPPPTTSSNPLPVRYVDSNPRPAKSPRHIGPPDLPTNPYSEYGSARFAPSYTGLGDVSAPLQSPPTVQTSVQQREYFPTTSSMSMQAWTTAADAGGIYGTSMPAGSAQQYNFSGDSQYVKNETASHYTWNPV